MAGPKEKHQAPPLVFMPYFVRAILGAVLFGIILSLLIFKLGGNFSGGAYTFAFHGMCEPHDSFCYFSAFVLPGLLSSALFGLSLAYSRIKNSAQALGMGAWICIVAGEASFSFYALIKANGIFSMLFSWILGNILLFFFAIIVVPASAFSAFLVVKLLGLDKGKL